MSEKVYQLMFPAGGIRKDSAHEELPNGSTFRARNVRADDTFSERVRGGSRPGLAKASFDQLGSGAFVRLINEVNIVDTGADGLSYVTDVQDLGYAPGANPTTSPSNSATEHDYNWAGWHVHNTWEGASGNDFGDSTTWSYDTDHGAMYPDATTNLVDAGSGEDMDDYIGGTTDYSVPLLLDLTRAIGHTDAHTQAAGTIEPDSTKPITTEFYIVPHKGLIDGALYFILPGDNLTLRATNTEIPAFGGLVFRIVFATGNASVHFGYMSGYVGSGPDEYTHNAYEINAGQSAGWNDVTITDGDPARVKFVINRSGSQNTLDLSINGSSVLSSFQLDDPDGGGHINVGSDQNRVNKWPQNPVFSATSNSSTQRFLIKRITVTRGGDETAGTATTTNTKSVLVAAANGTMYVEGAPYSLTAESTTASVASDQTLESTERTQKLYIADWDQNIRYVTDNSGTINGTALDDPAVSDWTTLGISTNDHMVEILDGDSGVTVGSYTISSIASGNLTLGSSASASSLNCDYRIVRSPKVYDPKAGTMTQITASAGNLPLGCRAVCLYRDRLVWANKDIGRNEWFMSKRADPTDYNYGADATVKDRAVAGSSTDAGIVGDDVVALAPLGDDYLIFGCLTSMWQLRGDPAFGGEIDNISRSVGIVGPRAWCRIADGSMLFLSRDGLYSIPPTGGTPKLVSEQLPVDLEKAASDNFDVLLEYNVNDKAVHILFASEFRNQTAHYYFDIQRAAFFEDTLDGTLTPVCTYYRNSRIPGTQGMLIGGQDGYIRRFDDEAGTDDGLAFTSQVVFTPMRPGGSLFLDGTAVDLVVVLSQDSENCTLNAYGADQAESVYDDIINGVTPFQAITITSGRNQDLLRLRNGTVAFEITSTGRWAYEGGLITFKPTGRQRLG